MDLDKKIKQLEAQRNRALLEANKFQNTLDKSERKKRTHKMCTLSGDIEKIFSDQENEKIFDNEFELKRKYINYFFTTYFDIFSRNMSYREFAENRSEQLKAELMKNF